MADVYCASCGEPWYTDHLRHELPYEVGDWTGWNGQVPLDLIREKLEKLGWKFGSSAVVVLECPCCEANGILPDADTRKGLYSMIGQVLEGDEDTM